MDSISPAWLLLAALVCSLVARFMIVRAAFSISKGWGFAVIFLPLAPMFFRWNYKELAHEGKSWGFATAFFAAAFFVVTGSTGSADELWSLVPEKWRPAEYASHEMAEEPETEVIAKSAEEPEEGDGAEAPGTVPTPQVAVAKIAPAPAKPGFFGRIAAMMHAQPAAPAAPGKTSTKPAATPAPAAPTFAQRVAVNQAEFARLGVVYENLKKEKGYLRKWDNEAITAYNAEAAKYQAALAAARAEQTELNKRASVAKK